ncbi:MAG: hypothetical protein COW19_10755 [Zetaproteobacteria bacterium CG12_big_fil_rev_8_21_14_0_65_55_1124]|nr:MAG: hypothetical protein COW19_10755 [Zetaproteobacteria bacterium CG12_big_fil_rev_8_21_14_0_65_55_1124]PIZ37012.1 MAG: hypothetical protein COY36_10590 [Zetaproteobacteria bacterium CG_4_10_14_0_2_um_filter_55_20]PJB81340.1 MAG: hypothetical protein CO089_04845 [Zetaproteobacteria bacterium CG_4_9_14_0_8_um_filter_55_31]
MIPGGKVKNVTTDETGALKSKFAIEKSSGSMHQTVVESGGKASEHENDANESRKSVIARQDKPQSK